VLAWRGPGVTLRTREIYRSANPAIAASRVAVRSWCPLCGGERAVAVALAAAWATHSTHSIISSEGRGHVCSTGDPIPQHAAARAQSMA
jgi:hypothetical protein